MCEAAMMTERDLTISWSTSLGKLIGLRVATEMPHRMRVFDDGTSAVMTDRGQIL